MTGKDCMDYSHVTTIIFDMDGTLIKHTWQLKQLTKAVFDKFADRLSPVTHKQFFDCFFTRSADMWYMMIDGVIDGDTAAKYGYINTLRALKQDISFAEPMLDYWEGLVLDEAIPFDDTFTVLNSLRQKYNIGILTNGFTRLQRRKIERYNLAEYVNFTLISEDIGYHKPDKRAFLAALKVAGDVLPEQTLFVGDNLLADIEGAQNAGLRPILMNPADNIIAHKDELIKIRQLSELLVMLN